MKYKCNICNKSFNNIRARNGHMYIHGPKYKCKWGCNKQFRKSHTSTHEKSCYLNPECLRHCETCGEIIKRNGLPNSKDEKKFCDSSCAAKTTNLGRVHSEESKDKTSKTLDKFYEESEYHRNYEKISEYNQFRVAVARRSKMQLRLYNNSEYKRYKSDKWNTDTNPGGLVIDHLERVFTCWCKGKSVEYTSDIKNLQVITQKENLKRQRGYSPKVIWETYRQDKYIHGNSKEKQQTIKHEFF